MGSGFMLRGLTVERSVDPEDSGGCDLGLLAHVVTSWLAGLMGKSWSKGLLDTWQVCGIVKTVKGPGVEAGLPSETASIPHRRARD